jgi:hypothetical protein
MPKVLPRPATENGGLDICAWKRALLLELVVALLEEGRIRSTNRLIALADAGV